MKRTCLTPVVAVAAVAGFAVETAATCDKGKVLIKFSHVAKTDKHPKGIAAALVAKGVIADRNGKACAHAGLPELRAL